MLSLPDWQSYYTHTRGTCSWACVEQAFREVHEVLEVLLGRGPWFANRTKAVTPTCFESRQDLFHPLDFADEVDL